MSAFHSQEDTPLSLQRYSDSIDTTLILPQRINWKKEMRKKCLTKHPIRKISPHLQDSSKTKNIPKNVTKAIIQLILNNGCPEQITVDQKQFLSFVHKNKNVQNLTQLIRLISPHKNEKINALRACFRKISWNFLKKSYVAYVFNSKIKDPQWHIKFRNDFLNIIQNVQ